MAVTHSIHSLPMTCTASAAEDALTLLSDLSVQWARASPYGGGDMEGLRVPEMEAAVSLWLAATEGSVRRAALTALSAIRVVGHHLQGHTAVGERVEGVSPTSHHLMDTITACHCVTAHLPFDSLLPTFSCSACGGGGREDSGSRWGGGDLVGSLTARVKREEARERREAEREVQARQSHGVSDAPARVEEGEEDADAPLPAQAQAEAVGGGGTRAEAKGAAAEVVGLSAELERAVLGPSEWKWSMVLAHWMRALALTSAKSSHCPSASSPSPFPPSVLHPLCPVHPRRAPSLPLPVPSFLFGSEAPFEVSVGRRGLPRPPMASLLPSCPSTATCVSSQWPLTRRRSPRPLPLF